MRRNKKSAIANLLDLLMEATNDFWLVGAVMTFTFSALCLFIANIALEQKAEINSATGVAPVLLQSSSFVLFLLAAMAAVFAMIFGWKTITTLSKRRRF